MGKILTKIKHIIRKALGIKKLEREILALKEQQELLLQMQRESLKAALFHDSIAHSDWLKNPNFSPGGWAVDYGFLYTLYRVLNDTKPKSILEFGLGQTSKMLYQYMHAFPDVQVCTIEHNQDWIEFFKNEMGHDYNTHIVRKELSTIEYNGYETLIYKDLQKEIESQQYDLIVVDGPYGSEHYSRSQLIDLVDNLSDHFCIILDDYEREGEQETTKEFEEKLRNKRIDYKSVVYTASKQHILLCSPNIEFLTTLYWF